MENYVQMIIDGYVPICDRCESIGQRNEVDMMGFYIRRKGKFMYCKPCWNYLHLVKWYCSCCGGRGKIRSDSNNVYIRCSCGNVIEVKR